MFSGMFRKRAIVPRAAQGSSQRGGHSEATNVLSGRRKLNLKEKMIIATIAMATVLCLWYDAEVTQRILEALHSRKLAMSLNLGGGACEWRAALQYNDAGFPSDTEFHKTIIAGYPSGDKRLTFIHLEGTTGLSARDEWDFKFLGMTNQPFIKANYPHHEGIWGWGNVGDQVVLVVSELKRVMVEYHDILWVSYFHCVLLELLSCCADDPLKNYSNCCLCSSILFSINENAFPICRILVRTIAT